MRLRAESGIDVDLTIQAMLPRAVELGVRWNLGSGLPYTRPLGGYVYYDYSARDRVWRSPSAGDSTDLAIVLGPRNGERYPVYHRLDVGVRRTFRRGWGTLTPYLDVLNVYNRRNLWFYQLNTFENPIERIPVRQLPVLPNISFEVRF